MEVGFAALLHKIFICLLYFLTEEHQTNIAIAYLVTLFPNRQSEKARSKKKIIKTIQ